MIVEIAMGLRSLKDAFDLTKGLNAANTQVQINEAKIGLQSAILDAQTALAAAQEQEAAATKRIAELEQEIVSLKDWSTEKQRYQMKRFRPGSVAYCLKPEMAEGEPPHRLCPHCYHNGKKGFLQATEKMAGGNRIHRCTSCQAEAAIGPELSDAQSPDPDPWSGPISSGRQAVP